GVVTEEVRTPVFLRITGARVDDATGDAVGRVDVPAVAELHQRSRVRRVLALGQLPVPGGAFGAFPTRPTVVPAGLHEVDLLPPVPADVPEDRQSTARVERQPEGAAEPTREDLAAGGVRIGRIVEGIPRHTPTVGGEVQDLALERVRFLGPQGARVHLGVA